MLGNEPVPEDTMKNKTGIVIALMVLTYWWERKAINKNMT